MTAYYDSCKYRRDAFQKKNECFRALFKGGHQSNKYLFAEKRQG